MKRSKITLIGLIGGVVLTLAACGGGGSGFTATPTPTPATWSVTGSLQTARYLHSATLLPNGKVLVIGGYASPNGIPSTTSFVSSVEQYDPSTKA